MREPWQVFRTTLAVALTVFLAFTIISVGWNLSVIGGNGAEKLSLWQQGIDRGVEDDGADDRAVDRGLVAEVVASFTENAPLLAMALFVVIPIVTYTLAAVAFLRHRRWAFFSMACVQIVVLVSVALPVLL